MGYWTRFCFTSVCFFFNVILKFIILYLKNRAVANKFMFVIILFTSIYEIVRRKKVLGIKLCRAPISLLSQAKYAIVKVIKSIE